MIYKDKEDIILRAKAPSEAGPSFCALWSLACLHSATAVRRKGYGSPSWALGRRMRYFRWKLPIYLYLPLVVLTVLGTDNGVNFTDGLDGLCSSVTAMVAGFFAVVALFYGSGMSIAAASVCGALLGFLLYNVYPAKVFMGGYRIPGPPEASGRSCRSHGGMELYIIIVGFIYLIEVVSVIIQVAYFKRTGGKRFFRMAPIHHHFELFGQFRDEDSGGIYHSDPAALAHLAFWVSSYIFDHLRRKRCRTVGRYL